MTNVIIMFSISVLSIILGFIALLTQKIYIDPKTDQPTQVNIPFIGKVKTNYPAMIFVFLGFVMAYVAFDKSFPPQKTQWEVNGSFMISDNEKIDWEKGTLTVFPVDFSPEVAPNGAFRVTAMIEEGKSFEDVIQYIDYSHTLGSLQIFPKNEYNAYISGTKTIIEGATKNTRKYKTVPLKTY